MNPASLHLTQMEPLGLFKRFSLPSPNSSALLRHAMGWATEFEAAISVGRTVLNPKMDGRYVTERERKFLIYRALALPSLGSREAKATSPYFCRPHCASDVSTFSPEFGQSSGAAAKAKATLAMQRME